MAATRLEMGLDMGHPGRWSHEAEGEGSGSMNEFFRNIGTEETDRNAIAGKMRTDFLIFERSYSLKLSYKRSFFVHDQWAY
jgi:hypothetical protein